MRPGTDAQRAMIEAMETATIGVIVLSPEFIAREWSMKELMCFLGRREESEAAGLNYPVVIPVFYRISIPDLYREPCFDRTQLYRESRFFERQKRGEPEANVESIKAALMTVRGITGLRNDVDASNDSSYRMSLRRDLLLQQLHDIVVEALPPRTTKMQSRKGSKNDLQNQGPLDSFRAFFPPLISGMRAVLDFNNRVNGKPKTSEGLVKQHLLEETTSSPRVVSLCGMGGVGKSTILQALSVDDQIRQRFADGIHIIRLGKDSSNATLFRELCRVLEESGAEKTSQSVRSENDMDAALRFFEKWFDGKRCGFLIDDVWMHGVELKWSSRLCKIGIEVSGNGVLITTREHEVASLAPSERIVQLNPREARGSDSRRILFFQADREEIDSTSASVKDSINRILEICDGLPVNLTVAGKNVKTMSIGFQMGAQHVWEEYLSELVKHRARLLRNIVGDYGNLFVTLVTSIASLDKRPWQETLGFSSSLSFTKMFRRLCVLRKQATVPTSMLRHLWETESEIEANMIAKKFIESGLASHEIVRCGGEFVRRLRLHDSVHDFATEEATRNCDTKEAHDSLVKVYKSLDAEISSEVRGTSRWWSRKLKTDGYIHRNLCRHLLGAGRIVELVQLLLSPEWVKRQLEVNDILYVESDFSVGITAVQNEMIDHDNQGLSEVKEAIRLIAEAVALSSGFILSNAIELLFQLHGRLQGYCECNREIRRYVSRLVQDSERPFIVCKTSFLGEPGAANTRIVSMSHPVSCMVIMKDRQKFACGLSNGDIALVDVKGSAVENQWKAHDDEVNAITITNDEARLISCSDGKTAKVWKVESGHLVTSFTDHSDWVQGVEMMSDGRRVFSICFDGTARIWNLETGQIASQPFAIHDSCFIHCVKVLEEDLIITGGNDNKLRMWNVMTDAQVSGTFDGHDESVECVAMTPDGQYVLSGSEDCTVRVWDVRSRQQVVSSFKGHNSVVSCVAVSEDGRRVASGSWDGTIRIWDLESQEEICNPLEGHTAMVSGVSFLGDVNDVVVSSSCDGTVRVWDLTRKNKKTLTNRHESTVSSVKFREDGRLVVSGSYDSTIRIWDATSGQQVGDALQGHSNSVTDVAVTPNGRFVVSVSWDKMVRVWDLESRELQHTFTGHPDWIECVAVTPQGDHAITGSYDKSVRIWDLEAMDGSHVVLNGHDDCVSRVFVSDDGLRAVSVDDIDNIFIWELETKKVVKKFKMKAAKRLSRRQVWNIVGETTVHDDTTLSIPLEGCEIFYGEGPDERKLATLESFVSSWALSPDKKTICVGLRGGRLEFLKLER